MSEIVESQENIPINAHNLTLTIFHHQQDLSPKGAIVIAPAIGLRQEFYFQLARFFAANGYIAISFDYYGMGRSRDTSLRNTKVTLIEWAEIDIHGVINYISDKYVDLDIIFVGHSLSGQLLGLLEPHPKLKTLVFVTVNNGYWRYHKTKYRTGILLYTLFPVLTWLLGYFPGKVVGIGDNLPKLVALQWAKWLKSRDYLFGDDSIATLENFSKYTLPMLAYSFDDDIFATKEAVDNMVYRYTNAKITRRHVTPQELQVNAIGHVGYFKEMSKHTLWSATLKWINEQITSL